MTVIQFHVIWEIICKYMKWIHALIPNLTALRALVSLSETGSITRTAQMMSLTQSAVSHQMRNLNDTLGFAPLVREGRRVRLSHRAQQYVAQIAPALEALEIASGASKMKGQLRLNVAPGFAAHWLAPRLSSFSNANPDLRIHLTSARGYGDLGPRDDDLYISFAEPHQVPKAAHPLMSVDFFPVAAPELLAGQRLQNHQDVLDYPLLHLNGTDDWQNWLGNSEVTGGIIFQDMLIMQSAVLSGQGIALGDPLTCADALARGDLIKLFDVPQKSSRSYWLIEGKEGTHPAREAFSKWLVGTMTRDGF